MFWIVERTDVKGKFGKKVKYISGKIDYTGLATVPELYKSRDEAREVRDALNNATAWKGVTRFRVARVMLMGGYKA